MTFPARPRSRTTYDDLLMTASAMISKLICRKSAHHFTTAWLLCAIAFVATGPMVKSALADERPATGRPLRPASTAPVANRLIFAPATQSASDRRPVASQAAEQQKPLQPQSTPEIDQLQQRKQQTLDELHDKAARLVLLMRQKKARQQQAAEERDAADRAKALEAIPLAPVTEDANNNAGPTEPPANTAQPTDASAAASENGTGGSQDVDGANSDSSEDDPSNTDEGDSDAQTSVQDGSQQSANNGSVDGSGNAAGAANMSAEEFEANPISGPIDRLALATSLFATKQYAGCMKALDALDKETLSAESQDWCLYMSACCYRKQGELSEAESGYRTIVNKSETRWLVEASRWWLSHLNDQQKLTADLTQVNTTLDTWQKEIHAIKNSN